jgi:hypothetical protein
MRHGRLKTLALLAVIAAAPVAAEAATSWARIKDVTAAQNVCLDVGGREYPYVVIGATAPAACAVVGPRRLKVASRYVYDGNDGRRVAYTVIVEVDGREVLRKEHTALPKDTVAPCGATGRVGTQRNDIVDIDTGRHEVRVRAVCEGRGRVAARLYRQGRPTPVHTVPFTPDSYDGVRELQFTSGQHSTYYHLTSSVPVRFTVNGPTNLTVHARLDHDLTMSGSQSYALEVTCDGVSWRTFHFDSRKLTTVVYAYTPEVLPGNDNELRIPVVRGRHVYEIRCLRPETCGVAVQIRIPRADLAP